MAFQYDKTELLKSWEHCSLFIVEKISELDTEVKELKSEVRKLSYRLQRQEARMAIIGGLAGMVAAGIVKVIVEKF